jgi:hypothetical protein
MRLPPRMPGHFDVDGMPRHQGGGPTIPPDPDCCAEDVCPQRDYNRLVVLTLLRLSQSYAGLLLLQRASRQLWHCSDGIHTDCLTPECTFGSVQADMIAVDIDALAAAIKGLFASLSRPAADLTGQWQDLSDMETAAQALEFLDAQRETDMVAENIFTDTMQRHIVDEDASQFERWFRPPPSES